VIHDFAGPYAINHNNMAFGAPTRYIQLDPDKCSEMDWDTAVDDGNQVYCQRMHNICFDNCHSHVARCLNNMGYRKYRGYNMFHIGIVCFFFGKFVSPWAFIKTYAPFCVFLVFILFLSGSLF
jgi:transmembrane protein 222